ncbi:MAG: hypothetical protein V3U71_03310 [Cocleimonas sp.]
MQATHIIAIIVRLFAIAIFLKSLTSISTFFMMPYESKFLVYHIAGVTSVIASLLLWFFPTSIAHFIIPFEKPTETSHSKLDLNDLYHLGFIILSIYLLFNVFSDVVYWLSFTAYATTMELPYLEYISNENKAAMVTTALEFILVMFILLRRKSIIALFRSHKIK